MKTNVMRLALASLLSACGASSTQRAEVSDGNQNAPAPRTIPERVVAERHEIGLDAPSDVSAPPADALRTPSGLASRVLASGGGTRHPGSSDAVVVHYTGWRAETGERFDSSVERGEPLRFPLDRVIPGWQEGVQLMVEGEIRRLWIPASLAYEGRPSAPQGMLVFDVELLEIVTAPPTPADVSAPPPEAQRSASGLAWIVVRPGPGTRHPSASDRVTVHYTGWRAETGEMFDSSRTRGEPATFPLDRVIAGWTEGVQLMVEGEIRRLWIPSGLAYGDEPGRGPTGMLVFDIELIRIE